MSHQHSRLTSLLDMYRFDAVAYHRAVTVLSDAIAMIRGALHTVGHQPLDDKSKAGVLSNLAALSQALDPIAAPVTKLAILEFELHLNDPEKVTIFDLAHRVLIEISETLRRELFAARIYVLDRAKASFYESPDPPFGAEVDGAFPACRDDIEEAGKCFALGRNTAVVFHLSRAMEAAVQALSTKLGIPNPEREWGKLLSDIKEKIEAMPKGTEIRNRWSENHTLLYHVKQAWRNDVMHPKESYTDEQAEEVYRATKSFMRNLVPLVA